MLADAPSPLRGLRSAVVAFVVAFAFFHFADLTADPDVWGHVLFGYRTLDGGVERAEPFSWTAPGHSWINHEVLSEAALALAHRAGGASGLWLLSVMLGLLTWGLAWRMARREVPDDVWWLPAAVALVASVQIAFGFAPRPQIFTAFFLAAELWVLSALHRGRWGWGWALPPLFAVWINTHGGVLAGVVVLAAAAGATALEWLWVKSRGKPPAFSLAVPVTLALVTAAGGAALFMNPWGGSLPRWLVASVSWVRPEIEEWNATPLNWTHLPFFVLLILTVAAGLAERLRRPGWWRSAVLLLLAVMGWRHVRHTALFAIAALALAPGPLAEWARGLPSRAPGLRRLLATPTAARLLRLGSGALMAAALFYRKEHPAALEVPRSQYPLEAVRFMQEARLEGRLLCFFDWGELCLWELPGLQVSVDGRLDTCYPRVVLDDHWSLYRGDFAALKSVNLAQADVALLRQGLPGTPALAAQPGWTIAYVDPLAVVLLREPARYPGLQRWTLPVTRGPEALQGRARFPREEPARGRPDLAFDRTPDPVKP